MFISIIIPCHKEAERIEKTIERLKDFFKISEENHPKIKFECVFVENGSPDQTFKILLENKLSIESENVSVKILQSKKGKGLAIKKGLDFSAGDYVLFYDADNSTDIFYLNKLINIIKADNSLDIINTSRRMKGSRVFDQQTFLRRFFGNIFHKLVHLLFDVKVTDTQNGFKFFKKEVVQNLFGKVKTFRWLFDLELFILARKNKYKIKEIPITWINNKKSSFNLKETFLVFIDLLKILKS